MGRAQDWVHRSEQRKEAYLNIQNEAEQSVNVYRATAPTAGAGFKGEVSSPSFVKVIQARIDKAKTDNFRKKPDNDQTPAQWIALTDDKNVFTGDLWRAYNIANEMKYYRVVSVEPNEAGNIVYLDELRKDVWPKTAL